MLDSGIELKMLCCMVVITVSEQIGMVFVFASNVKSMKPHDDTFEDFLGILFCNCLTDVQTSYQSLQFTEHSSFAYLYKH